MSVFRPTFKILSFILFCIATILLVPIAISFFNNSPNTVAFSMTLIVALVLGLICRQLGQQDIDRILPRQMYMITGLSWIVVTLVCSLPFVFGEPHLSLVDATFEATSGITTTGSTVIVDIDHLPRELLLWRSITQWIGGLGIIGMMVAVFPYLRIGGMKLFQTETSDWTENHSNRAQKVAWDVARSYLILSLACMLAYHILGMDWFEAVNFAMTTISTGGFATSSSSFGHFHNLPIFWVATLFMLLGSVPFVLYFQSIKSHRLLIFKDKQVIGLLKVVSIVICTVIILRLLNGTSDKPGTTLTHIVFNVVSIITTTGFASQDYLQWGGAIAALFLFATFIGGCSGSTSGGIKIFRFQLFSILTKVQFLSSIHPAAKMKHVYNGRPISDSILVSTASYFFIVILSIVIFSLALAGTGLDFITSFSGAVTALMNVGPGLGNQIGPNGNFESMSDIAKLVLCFAMLLGRLEFITLLVILSPRFWKW